MPDQLKVYVECPLTHASEEFKNHVVPAFKRKLQEGGLKILEFVGLQGSTPLGVYTFDLNQVLQSDLTVALLEGPSDGGGMEAQTGQLFRVPGLMLAREGARVSRMNAGLCEFARSIGQLPHMRFERCEDYLTDGVEKVFAYVRYLHEAGMLPRPASWEDRRAEALRFAARFYDEICPQPLAAERSCLQPVRS